MSLRNNHTFDNQFEEWGFLAQEKGKTLGIIVYEEREETQLSPDNWLDHVYMSNDELIEKDPTYTVESFFFLIGIHWPENDDEYFIHILIIIRWGG